MICHWAKLSFNLNLKKCFNLLINENVPDFKSRAKFLKVLAVRINFNKARALLFSQLMQNSKPNKSIDLQ